MQPAAATLGLAEGRMMAREATEARAATEVLGATASYAVLRAIGSATALWHWHRRRAWLLLAAAPGAAHRS